MILEDLGSLVIRVALGWLFVTSVLFGVFPRLGALVMTVL